MQEEIILKIEYNEEEIQSFAEANFDRELTDIELNRIREYWYEMEDVTWARMELMARAIEGALDNADSQWKGVDEDYQALKK